MASTKIQSEPITSDPVIVCKCGASTTASTTATAEAEPEVEPVRTKEEILNERISKLETTLQLNNITDDSPPTPRFENAPTPGAERTRPYFRGRSRSRSPVRIINDPPPPKRLFDSATLEGYLSTSDVLVEVTTGTDYYQRISVYITNLSFHAAELEKIEWIFRFGLEDGWTHVITNKPKSYMYQNDAPRGGRRRADSFDDRFDDRNGNSAIVKMGNALNVLSDEKKDCGIEKVKFLTVVQGKNTTSLLKLIVSHSRKSALVDIFHEILNGHSIIFVGAVLKDAEVPVEKKFKEDIKFVKVESVEEAEACGEDVIGVIC